MENNKNSRVDCLQCIYFAITWDRKQPRACKLFGFKTSAMPSADVYRSTGTTCMGFERKPERREKSQ